VKDLNYHEAWANRAMVLAKLYDPFDAILNYDRASRSVPTWQSITTTAADRQRHVQVSVRLDLDRHKLVPWDLGHCTEDSLVQRGLADLDGNLVCVRPDRRNQLSSLFLEIFRAHVRLTATTPSGGRETSDYNCCFANNAAAARLVECSPTFEAGIN